MFSMKLVLIFLYISFASNAFADDILVTIDGVEAPLRCKEEPFFENQWNDKGYFCQDGEKYLIIKDSGGLFTAYGSLEDTQKSKTYALKKIVSIDGKKAEDWYRHAMKRCSAASDGYRFAQATNRFTRELNGITYTAGCGVLADQSQDHVFCGNPRG